MDMSTVVSPLTAQTTLRRGKQPNGDPEKGIIPKFRRENTATRREATENRIRAADRANDALRKTDASVNVDVQNLFIYLGKDGTVISIHQADRGFGDPIYRRLRQRDGILRSTGDPSLLLQALLDLGEFTKDRTWESGDSLVPQIVVDRAIDIVDRFHESILKMEREILLHPKMTSIRNCAPPPRCFSITPLLRPACFSALTVRRSDAATTRA